MWLIVVIIIGFVIWAYSSAKKTEREQEEARIKRERENYIRRNYPNAYKRHWGQQVPTSNPYRSYFSEYNKKADGSCCDSEWKMWEDNIIKQQEAAKRKEEDKKWEKAQENFASHARGMSNKIMPDFGYYSYTVNVTTQNGIPLNMEVCQHFIYAVCLESDLDYTYNNVVKENTKHISFEQKNGVLLQEKQFNPINSFIKSLSEDRKVLVFCNDQIPGWNNIALTNTYLHISAAIPDDVREINVAVDKSIYGEIKQYGRDLLPQESPDVVVVIDAFTENDDLKKNCKFIFNTFQKKRPLLAYISIDKCYDRAEMVDLIESSKLKALKREADEKAKEAERKRKKEERARLQATASQVLAKNVQDWEYLYDDFYYTWLFYYYPTTCDFDASKEEWNNRYKVWDFKNDPEKHISPQDHEDTLGEIIPQIKQKLSDTFGEEYLQFLTLVCLPASTTAKNKARYEEFSQRLCDVTGMENAYNYIHIVKDGMSKKDPSNMTGRSIQPKVSFEDRFSDKYVLLFDDVITKGDTMLRYKSLMEKMGATVVGGFTIGKTKHERP